MEDGFDPETRQILVDLSIAVLIIAIIFMPQYCFRSKYQDELDQMKADGVGCTEFTFSKEEIDNLKRLERKHQKEMKEKVK